MQPHEPAGRGTVAGDLAAEAPRVARDSGLISRARSPCTTCMDGARQLAWRSGRDHANLTCPPTFHLAHLVSLICKKKMNIKIGRHSITALPIPFPGSSLATFHSALPKVPH